METVTTHPQRQEYQVLTKEQVGFGQRLDTLEFLNEVGQDGWIVINVREGVAQSGMVLDNGQPIPKIVLEVLARRPIIEHTALPSEDVQP